MKKYRYRGLLAVVMVALLTAGSYGMATNEKIIIKLAHADSTDINISRKQAMSVTFANLINGKSGGRLEVQIFGAGALGGEREYVEAIKAGQVQAGIASGVISNFYPEAMVTDIPYLFPSAQIAWQVLDGPFGKKLAEGFNKTTGMRNLAFGEVGFRHFSNGKHAIHSPKDLQGLKIRVMETPLFMTMMKAMGASPIPVAWPEVYTALQTGVVDGQENPIGSIISAKLYEVQKYVILDGHVYGVDWFVMNDKFFKSLATDLQRLVLDSAKIAANEERRFVQVADSNGLQILTQNKTEVYTPTAAEMSQFKKLAQQPCIDWMKTKINSKLINEALKAVKTAETKAAKENK
ncbi:MAG TPA: DctP family TRAP transporter solute-binding subunit [Bacillota bacterium]|nr:DctP family TRAP transporter solute-binding subunit [Bacillota bacterium]